MNSYKREDPRETSKLGLKSAIETFGDVRRRHRSCENVMDRIEKHSCLKKEVQMKSEQISKMLKQFSLLRRAIAEKENQSAKMKKEWSYYSEESKRRISILEETIERKNEQIQHLYDQLEKKKEMGIKVQSQEMKKQSPNIEQSGRESDESYKSEEYLGFPSIYYLFEEEAEKIREEVKQNEEIISKKNVGEEYQKEEEQNDKDCQEIQGDQKKEENNLESKDEFTQTLRQGEKDQATKERNSLENGKKTPQKIRFSLFDSQKLEISEIAHSVEGEHFENFIKKFEEELKIQKQKRANLEIQLEIKRNLFNGVSFFLEILLQTFYSSGAKIQVQNFLNKIFEKNEGKKATLFVFKKILEEYQTWDEISGPDEFESALRDFLREKTQMKENIDKVKQECENIKKEKELIQNNLNFQIEKYVQLETQYRKVLESSENRDVERGVWSGVDSQALDEVEETFQKLRESLKEKDRKLRKTEEELYKLRKVFETLFEKASEMSEDAQSYEQEKTKKNESFDLSLTSMKKKKLNFDDI